MGKKETFILFLMSGLPLYGEISLGMLKSIEDNGKLNLLYKNTIVSCTPFGVVPLETMAKTSKECAQAVDTFYQNSPHERVFAKEHLIIGQSYHFEQITEGCLLYANGLETYSEMLLSRGIAMMDPKLDNREWKWRFMRAQQGAQRQKKGFHPTDKVKECLKKEK
ncbi:MAG: hypothetical protein M0P91_08620 [Sulfuricurvum sp.]|jgi:hypothetical protein|uniref:hypothetical protein n=1 Tax=Sulfuricurvum sp. TaxID=2025608 RepID=UPI0025DE83FC|nr:hypothetical protein [Sulfuricurvum sp.]MCK9373248.1 hypothetical protein [Sulfuricurvum sp.]